MTDCVYPDLVSCTVPVEQILPSILTMSWSRGMGHLVRAQNIHTIGNLSALKEEQVFRGLNWKESTSPWGRGYSLQCLIRGAPPERGTFFRIQLYERAWISPVAKYERVGKSVISVCEMAQKSQKIHFMAVRKSRKQTKYSGFTAEQLKGIESSKSGV